MKVVFGGRLGHDEPVTHEGGGLDPSRKGARRDSCHRSSHMVGRPHSAYIGETKLNENHKKIRLLAIKFAQLYKGVLTVTVDRDDPAADIM